MPCGMNGDLIREALALAERHVEQGDAILAQQRAVIAALELIGQDAAASKEILSVFEDTQRSRIADRDRLRMRLQNAD